MRAPRRVFVDIDPETLGMSTAALWQVLAARPEVKVVIPVHLGGLTRHASDDPLRSLDIAS